MVSRGTRLKGCISEPQANHKYFNGSLLICDLRSCYVRQMSPNCNFMGGERAKNSHLSYNLQPIFPGIAQTEAILWLIFILAIV